VLVDVNSAYADILGRTVAETLGLNYWKITPGKYAEQERMGLELLETTGSYGPYEKEYCHKDGHLVPVRLNGRIIERNKVPFIWSSVEDITDRKETEAEIIREHSFSEALIDSLPGVVYLYDHEMNFLRWNRNFERVTGYAAEEIAQLRPLDIFAAKDQDLLRSRIQEVFARGASNVEADLLAKDGSSTPYFFTGVRTEIDGKTCLIGIGIDISQRKRLEEELTALNLHLEARVAERTRELNEKSAQLVAANEKLKEVDRLKSMFIASMSHELRTPLNSVIGFSSILLNEWLGPLQPNQKENLAIVLRAGKHLLSLINDVIDVSKIEAGQIEVHKEGFDLFDLVLEAVQQLEPEIHAKGLAISVSNIHLQLLADRRRLLQAALNLLSNAMKYTTEGSILISARVDGGWAEISVADTGIGIGEQDAKLVFQPFRRLDSPLKGTVSGTGLGLYLTNKLVRELLGGTITFVSAVGQGSTFTIRIPVAADAASERRPCAS
jgi:PAS domain S-box-containing protein